MIIPLEDRDEVNQSKRLAKSYHKVQQLIEVLNTRTDIPSEVEESIQKEAQLMDEFEGSPKELCKFLNKGYTKVLTVLRKELGLVPKGYHRTKWMSLGMAIWGIPIGMILSIPLGNMGMIGTGIPIGMGIGIAIGSGLDQKAEKEGKQLDLESEAF